MIKTLFKSLKKKSKYTYLISSGHNSDTAGKRFSFGDEEILEYQVNRDITNYLTELLDKSNISYKVLNGSDESVTLKERCRRANIVEGNTIFIGIHSNAGGGHGYEVHVSDNASTKSVEIGEMYLNEMGLQFSDLRNRGLKRSNFYVLKHTKMPAILVENLFYDNKNEFDILKSTEGKVKIANALWHMIVDFELNN